MFFSFPLSVTKKKGGGGKSVKINCYPEKKFCKSLTGPCHHNFWMLIRIGFIPSSSLREGDASLVIWCYNERCWWLGYRYFRSSLLTPSHLCWSLSTVKLIPVGPLDPVCPCNPVWGQPFSWIQHPKLKHSCCVMCWKSLVLQLLGTCRDTSLEIMSGIGAAYFICPPEGRNFFFRWKEGRIELSCITVLAVTKALIKVLFRTHLNWEGSL